MAKATIELANGGVVTIEGTPEEVQQLLEIYGGSPAGTSGKVTSVATEPTVDAPPSDEPDLAQIVNLIKTSDEAEQIEEHILDKASAINRVLLPLYIIHEYLENRYGLTTVQISQITTDLGVRILRQNAYRALTGSGSGYVVADRVRRRGVGAKYQLNRRGVKYLKTVIAGS